jgi:hypothetical protein
MEKAELIITALQQRIGQLVADSELQMAILRAEFTELNEAHNALIKEQEKKKKAIDQYEASLAAKTKK